MTVKHFLPTSGDLYHYGDDRLHNWSKIAPAFQYFPMGQNQYLVWRGGTIARGTSIIRQQQDVNGNSDTIQVVDQGEYDFLLRFDLQPAHGANFVQIRPRVFLGAVEAGGAPGGHLGGDKFIQNKSIPGSWDWQAIFTWKLRLAAGALVRFEAVVTGGTPGTSEEVGDGSLDVIRTR